MRQTIIAATAACAVTALASIAQAAPTVPRDALAVTPAAGILEVRGGCGPGWYPVFWRDRWGRPHRRCVPFRRW